MTVEAPHRHSEGVDLHVGGAVDGSLGLVAGDVEQRAVPELVRPLHLQRCLTECTGPVVEQLPKDMEEQLRATFKIQKKLEMNKQLDERVSVAIRLFWLSCQQSHDQREAAVTSYTWTICGPMSSPTTGGSFVFQLAMGRSTWPGDDVLDIHADIDSKNNTFSEINS